MLQASLETGAAPAAPIALAEWRLKLIEHHYPDALTERLGAIYPGVARLVGARYFRAAGRRFATRNPPRTLAAADFGAGFSGFLSAQPAARLLPYLPDLARLEWAVHAARRAPRVPALPADALDRFRDDEYRRIALILHPSCQLVRSRHPVLDIYRATLPETDPLEFVAPSAEGVRLMLKATATRVAFRGLDAQEFRFVAALRGGRTVAAARPHDSFDTHASIARLAASGALIGYAVQRAERA